MVKFGRHLQFFLESDETNGPADDVYIVPYTDIKESIGQSQHQFTTAWMAALNQASDDYSQRIKAFWKRVFDDIFESSVFDQVGGDYRGLQREEAVTLYVSSMDEGSSRELFSMIKKLRSTAAMNCEALRKLVKKFDKGALARGDDQLTSTLLHELYSVSFSSFTSLDGYIEIFRDSLVVSEEEDDEDNDSENEIFSYQEKSAFVSHHDGAAVKRRAEEQSWLTGMLATIPPKELSALVAHRGFHCPRDGSSIRPLENSLSAFEMAWAGGIELCECDVALTKDEKLVLAHDEDFRRLALHPKSEHSNMKVGALTMKEIISLTFKSGSRPPLLLDVLKSAQALGSNCKLVIEVKPGNQEASSALVRLFRHHPDLIENCAVVMSFDAFIMHRLKSELEEMKAILTGHELGLSVSPATKHMLRNRADIPIKLPEVLLLTVANEPKKHYELCLNILHPNRNRVHSWLNHSNRPSLDGVYLQYQSEMLEPTGMQALRDLSEQYRVGIWGRYKKDPDDYNTAYHLINNCGVTYVNTDLPRNFRQDPKEHRMAL